MVLNVAQASLRVFRNVSCAFISADFQVEAEALMAAPRALASLSPQAAYSEVLRVSSAEMMAEVKVVQAPAMAVSRFSTAVCIQAASTFGVDELIFSPRSLVEEPIRSSILRFDERSFASILMVEVACPPRSDIERRSCACAGVTILSAQSATKNNPTNDIF